MTRLVLGTRNDHKVREFARLLPGIELEPLPDGVETPPEDGDTYAANALIKARAAAAATGGAVLADDSGIGAEALGWAPGVYSARYAGEHATDEENLAKLLREAPAGSPVMYVCALAFAAPGGTEHLFEGTCDGVMAAARSGNRGFGYDPVFALEDGRTMAELAPEEKDAISHRGRAANELLAWLAGAEA